MCPFFLLIFFFTLKKAEETRTPRVTSSNSLPQVYQSKILHPPILYYPDTLLTARISFALANGGVAPPHLSIILLTRSLGNFKADLAPKVEECIWVSYFSTRKYGQGLKKTEIGFSSSCIFKLLVSSRSSSLFLRPFIAVSEKPVHKAAR